MAAKKKINKTQFVKSLPKDMTAKDVVRRAKDSGIVISEAYVYTIRSAASRAGASKGSSTSSKASKGGKSTAKKGPTVHVASAHKTAAAPAPAAKTASHTGQAAHKSTASHASNSSSHSSAHSTATKTAHTSAPAKKSSKKSAKKSAHKTAHTPSHVASHPATHAVAHKAPAHKAPAHKAPAKKTAHKAAVVHHTPAASQGGHAGNGASSGSERRFVELVADIGMRRAEVLLQQFRGQLTHIRVG